MYLNTESELRQFYISTNLDYIEIRKKEQTEAISLLTKKKMAFIEVGLGGGLYGFIYSIAIKFKAKNIYFRINFAEVIVKNQIDDTFVASTGVNSQLLVFEMSKNSHETYVIIIDNIRGDIEQEALEYLVQLSVISRMKNSNIYYIFSSPITHTQFKESTIQLKDLTLDETSLILKRKFPATKLDINYIFELHNLSEGVVIKLEKIINSLNYSSPAEVLDETTLFDDIYQSDDIPQNIISQINYISQRVDKQLTFIMLKILSILKNGESLTNLKKDKIGKDLTLKNSREIIQLGLASVIEIDTSTTLIKLNPIIKDYVLSLLTEDEIHTISSAYLKIVINETKDGIHLGVNNRKIIDKGYNTEEDNAVVLFKNSILECKHKISSFQISENELGFYNTKLSRLLYLSLAYVYALDNSCRYKEAIFAASSFLQVTLDINNPSSYKLYYHLGSCQRMLSYQDEALENLKKAKELCPLNDKQALEKIYIEELLILEETNIVEAVALSKRNKRNFKANTLAHVYSEYVASIDLPKNQRIAKLESLERKCRRLEFHTSANNILFTLNTIKEETGKISRLNKVMSTESNSYNYCKAMIYKHEILVGNGDFEKISENDLYILFNIFNYMFKQGFNSLLNRCHDVLWKIAENKRKSQVIIIIYFKSAISWQLNNRIERLEKYSALFNGLEFDDNGSMK